jgi:uncharacterized protein YjiS (DUF1127 family)
MSSSTIETRVAPSADLSPGSWLAAPVRSIRQGIAWIGFRRRLRRDVREMMALDDRILRDIGVRRSEVEYAARYGQGFERYKDGLRR